MYLISLTGHQAFFRGTWLVAWMPYLRQWFPEILNKMNFWKDVKARIQTHDLINTKQGFYNFCHCRHLQTYALIISHVYSTDLWWMQCDICTVEWEQWMSCAILRFSHVLHITKGKLLVNFNQYRSRGLLATDWFSQCCLMWMFLASKYFNICQKIWRICQELCENLPGIMWKVARNYVKSHQKLCEKSPGITWKITRNYSKTFAS